MYKLTLYNCTQLKYLEYSLEYPSVWKMWSTGLPNLKFWIFGLMYYNCSGKLIIMPTRILEKVILTYDFRRFRNSLTHFGALRRGVTLVDPSDPWDFLPRSPNVGSYPKALVWVSLSTTQFYYSNIISMRSIQDSLV